MRPTPASASAARRHTGARHSPKGHGRAAGDPYDPARCPPETETCSAPPSASRAACRSRCATSRGSPTTTTGPGRPGGHELFEAIDPERWRLVAGNPVRLLEEASPERLAAAAAAGRAARAPARGLRAPRRGPRAPGRRARLATPSVRSRSCAPSSPCTPRCRSTRAASAPSPATSSSRPPTTRCRFVGVGLLYRQGYFRQRVDATGLQHEYWIDIDPERLPAALVTGADGAPLTVTVPIADEQVRAQIWRVDVGRVPLYLLDSDLPRELAGRALDHLAPLHRRPRHAPRAVPAARRRRRPRARGARHRPGAPAPQRGPRRRSPRWSWRARRSPRARAVEDALADARERIGFTTHTPVPAGNDTYPVAQVDADGGRLRGRGGDRHRHARAPRVARRADAARPSRSASRSSRCAARRAPTPSAPATARSRARCGTPLWPERADEGVPIGHVTNGVHEPTWVGEAMRGALRPPPRRGLAGAAPPTRRPGRRVPAIPGDELWAARREQRERARRARARAQRRRAPRPRRRRSTTPQAAAAGFDPDALTIGFARRLATYKRLGLLVADVDGRARAPAAARTRSRSCSPARRTPPTRTASACSSELFALKPSPEVGARVVFLEDYDLAQRRARSCRAATCG